MILPAQARIVIAGAIVKRKICVRYRSGSILHSLFIAS
jgi:hypothetical protein